MSKRRQHSDRATANTTARAAAFGAAALRTALNTRPETHRVRQLRAASARRLGLIEVANSERNVGPWVVTTFINTTDCAQVYWARHTLQTTAKRWFVEETA